jgi:hypothetical protein
MSHHYCEGEDREPEPQPAKTKDQPLRVEVVDGELVIRIGISTLAFAQHFRQWNTGQAGYAVTDEKEFAEDVGNAMGREEEDGSSPLNDFLDRMCDAAADDGSIACESAELRYQVWVDGKPHGKGRLFKTDEAAWNRAGPLDRATVKPVLVTKDGRRVVLEGA